MFRKNFSVKKGGTNYISNAYLGFVLAVVILCFGAVDNAAALFPAIDDPIPPLIAFGNVNIEFQTIASGFASPVAHAVAPGHRDTLFIGDQTGQIWAIDLKGKIPKQLFADLSGRLIKLG